nr:MAG TPA: hypothetical protein [Bacteriophage sp.]
MLQLTSVTILLFSLLNLNALASHLSKSLIVVYIVFVFAANRKPSLDANELGIILTPCNEFSSSTLIYSIGSLPTSFMINSESSFSPSKLILASYITDTIGVYPFCVYYTLNTLM